MKSPSTFGRLAGLALIAVLTSTALGFQRTTAPTDLQRGLLYADLWMQISAEYVACCLQTYEFAGDRIESDIKRIRADENEKLMALRGAPAVIMDLDETVLDNAVFQTYLYDSGQNYSEDLFIRFMTENVGSIRLVPGAKEFIDRVEAQGITVVYITNRDESLRAATIEALAQWGVNVRGLDDPESLRLLLQKKGESQKKPRRDSVRAKYHVLALFGDQLGDFSDEFSPNNDNTAASRREAVYEYRRLWGTRWFVLPNPVYGQWQQVLRGDPEQYLRRAGK